jgi:hypothetical protein
VELVTTRAEKSGRAGVEKGRGGGHVCRERSSPQALVDLEKAKGGRR